LIDTLVTHFLAGLVADLRVRLTQLIELTALSLARNAKTNEALPVFMKEISWLWRTAYNCAIQGASEWANAEEKVAELFDVAKEVSFLPPTLRLFLLDNLSQLLELYCEAVPADVDPDVRLHIIDASFGAISGRGDDLSEICSLLYELTFASFSHSSSYGQRRRGDGSFSNSCLFHSLILEQRMNIVFASLPTSSHAKRKLWRPSRKLTFHPRQIPLEFIPSCTLYGFWRSSSWLKSKSGPASRKQLE
jgi:hypothetical protein